MSSAQRQQSPRSGFFITFEGSDGSGKSTQLKLLAKRLRAQGQEVLETVEPGGTNVGTQIRRILLDSANQDIVPTAELLLMFASRVQNVEQSILPALRQGTIVLCDRFTDSSLAYQGGGRNLGFDQILATHRLALGDFFPDLTICIDIDLETSLARAQGRNQRLRKTAEHQETRLDEQSFDFHERVSDAYHRIAQQEPDRFLLIDGRTDIETLAERIWAAVSPRLPVNR